MSDKCDEDEICPVCGYYCLGKGGVDCIDKAGKLDADLSTLERCERKEWERRNPGKTLHDTAMENVQKLRNMGSESPASPALLPCDCAGWCRDPALTNGVLTKHHPNCPLFDGKKKFMKIALVGGGCYIQPLGQLHNALDGELDGAEPGDKWELELVEMYQEEVDALPDFEGH